MWDRISLLRTVDQLEQEIYRFVKRFPFSKPEFVEDRIVNKHKLMTKTEFSGAMKRLCQRGDLYEPRPGFISVTFGRRPTRRFDEEGHVVKVKAVKVKVKDSKQKIMKSHVKLIKRKYVQGYKCRNCGKWIRRSWALTKPRKCPKCKTTKYYSKPVLLKAIKLYQRPTKLYRILIGYVEPSRVGKPGVTVARWKLPELTSEEKEMTGVWVLEKGFQCLVGKTKACTDYLYSDPVEIVEHLRDKHGINPDDQVIHGWTNRHRRAWEKHVSKR